ncbi:hypothetical protein C5Y96_12140 [Blastopirellula marina]|uniref:Uncharacterized protein n=1 Tax=Blastopirellula marina TaxID=124 RepID=A0A2S8FG11_9BACT|nr:MULTISPECIES: hypothetical protein [Pirellulaceae]PQO31101.1 hypothetical protein C5Y96_12140 [Blastopirellula marina]RCS51495.1 hypothetical protein DTL36_12150 [Bremerella cremea]
MSAYLILLTLFAIAWAIVGFSIAMLILKLRWKLVGAVFLITVGIVLPAIVASFAFNPSKHRADLLFRYGVTIFGMLEVVYEFMIVTSCGGFILGILVGTVAGLWPRKDEEGNRQQSAKSWRGWKLVVAGPLVLTIACTLFFLADLRAQQRLASLRAKYQVILEVQEDVAPRLQNDAALVHDALMLALLEDDSPDWVLKAEREAKVQIQPVPTKIDRRDYYLLKIFLPGFPQTSQVLEYVDRHEKEFLKLRSSVLVDGLEYRHWNEQVARFAAVHALAQIHQGDNDSALKDLQLLRAMATQSLDKRIEDSFTFVQIEEFRYLVFQAFLGHVSPVPDDVYQEMLTSIGDTNPSLRRSLKRQLSQHVVSSIDALLKEQTGQQRNFRETYRRMAERIIYQEHTPQCVVLLEDQINQAFDGSTDPFNVTLQSVFPAMWDLDEAWLMTSGFSSHVYLAVQIRYQHNGRLELVKAVQMLESQREEKGRFLTQQEFLSGITSNEFTSAIAIDYLTLHNPTTGKAEGAILAGSEHMQLHDYLGFYLGPAFFSILDDRWPTLIMRSSQSSSTWELAQVKNYPQRLVIPTPKASTSNPMSPMR